MVHRTKGATFKQSVVLPLVFTEYDPTPTAWTECFGFTDREKWVLMREMGLLIRGGEDINASQAFMRLLTEGKVQDNLLLYLAAYGAQELWAIMNPGITCAIEGEEEPNA
jgi:hypothetical protein